MSFGSTEVHSDGPNWTVVRTLTVRDVRSPLTLDVRLADAGVASGRRATATGTVDRLRAGARTGPRLLIGTDVRVSVDVRLASPRH